MKTSTILCLAAGGLALYWLSRNKGASLLGDLGRARRVPTRRERVAGDFAEQRVNYPGVPVDYYAHEQGRPWYDQRGNPKKAPGGFVWEGNALVRDPALPAPENGVCPARYTRYGKLHSEPLELFTFPDGVQVCLRSCGVEVGPPHLPQFYVGRSRRTGNCVGGAEAISIGGPAAAVKL